MKKDCITLKISDVVQIVGRQGLYKLIQKDDNIYTFSGHGWKDSFIMYHEDHDGRKYSNVNIKLPEKQGGLF